jgi:DNA-binding NarL/FixJ family response regulator
MCCAPAHRERTLLNILIVDDHALVRSAIRTRFKNYSEFIVCGEAVDGADAIEKAAKLKPDFILLDWAMPGINGGVTALVLKELMPDLRIIAFTIHAEELRASLPSKFGIDAVVAKSDGIGKVVECARSFFGPR